ncbi:MAG: HD domain-containing protein [Candidatus Gracilibacteria bacterium]|nr:HD domain-containing protein [Candidatus Gracilibacteria bacterium]
MNSIVIHTAEFVRKELEGLCSAHDFYHIERVWKLSQRIYVEEKRGDIVVIELGALLHESFDDKFYTKEQMQEKEILLETFLRNEGLTEERLAQVFFVIKNVGFGKSLERGADFPMTPELAIVEDADRLESIGAIAIARTFAYGGKMKRAIYDPTVPVVEVMDRESYKKSGSSSIQHFYEKLLKLRDLLHTSSAKKIAQDRHVFMETFLEQFHAEWNGEV